MLQHKRTGSDQRTLGRFGEDNKTSTRTHSLQVRGGTRWVVSFNGYPFDHISKSLFTVLGTFHEKGDLCW